MKFIDYKTGNFIFRSFYNQFYNIRVISKQKCFFSKTHFLQNTTTLQKDSTTQFKRQKFCDDCVPFLGKIYKKLNFRIPEEEKKYIESKFDSISRYGVSNVEMIRKVIQQCNIGEDDVFLDLGSGLGRPVFQVAMETNVKKAIGIEYSATRVNRSKQVLSLLREQGLKTDIEFIQDTFLNADLWEDATVVYSWSCLFSNNKLLKNVAEIAKNCKSLKYLALLDTSLEDAGLDPSQFHLQRFYTFIKEEKTWNYGNNLFIYKKL